MNAPGPVNLSVIKTIVTLLIGVVAGQVFQIAFKDWLLLLLLFGLLAFNEWFRNHLDESTGEPRDESGVLPVGYARRQRLYSWLHSGMGLLVSIVVVVFWASSLLSYDRFAVEMENFSKDEIEEMYASPIRSPEHVLNDSFGQVDRVEQDSVEISYSKNHSHYLAPAKSIFQHTADYVQAEIRRILWVILPICFVALFVFWGAETGTALRRRFFEQ